MMSKICPEPPGRKGLTLLKCFPKFLADWLNEAASQASAQALKDAIGKSEGASVAFKALAKTGQTAKVIAQVAREESPCPVVAHSGLFEQARHTSTFGVRRTVVRRRLTSAFDPKRTFTSPLLKRRYRINLGSILNMMLLAVGLPSSGARSEGQTRCPPPALRLSEGCHWC
jgi:hypothetical protein